MAQSSIDRRRLLQISALAAASAAAAGPAQGEDADPGGIFGYGLDGAPSDIAAVEGFFPPAEYGYVWDGPASERYPSGNREVGTATVRPREDGPGVTYEIDADIAFLDGAGEEQMAERIAIAQIFPALDGNIGVMIHTSFGAFSQGHVTEITDGRLTMQLVGLSDALGAQVYGGYIFDRSPDGYTVHGRARRQPDDGWTITGDSVWTRKAG